MNTSYSGRTIKLSSIKQGYKKQALFWLKLWILARKEHLSK